MKQYLDLLKSLKVAHDATVFSALNSKNTNTHTGVNFCKGFFASKQKTNDS